MLVGSARHLAIEPYNSIGVWEAGQASGGECCVLHRHRVPPARGVVTLRMLFSFLNWLMQFRRRFLPTVLIGQREALELADTRVGLREAICRIVITRIPGSEPEKAIVFREVA